MKILNYLRKRFKPVKYLKKQGAKIGNNVIIDGPVSVTEGFLLEIGDNCNLSVDVCFFTHDGSNTVLEHLGYSKPGYKKYGKIVLGNNVFVGAKTIFLPGVTIGDNVIIGAGSVVTKSFPSNVVVAGSPAKIICSLEEFKEKNIGKYQHISEIKK